MGRKFKDYYDLDLANNLSKKISQINEQFDQQVFISHIRDQLRDQNLFARLDLFSDAFDQALPADYPENINTFTHLLGPELQTEKGMYSEGWWLWPLGRYAERHALDDYQTSLAFSYLLTKRFTGEFTMRPLLAAYPEKTLNILLKWARDENVHVRRLSSECLRIRLPWAKRLTVAIDYFDAFRAILTQLNNDRSRFVQKSVANNLNDLMKEQPDKAREIIDEWQKSKLEKETSWIIRHGTRNERKISSMSSVEEKLAKSLTAESVDLIPYLPYLLQDLWDLGSSPEDIIQLVSKHTKTTDKIKVLDLACGKGAVSIQVAKAFGCAVKGIDYLSEFISYAISKSEEYGVQHLCTFEIGDINKAVQHETNYDIVILGAAGDVLGSPGETLSKLRQVVKKDGHIIIDDGYAKDGSNEGCPTREQWMQLISSAGLMMVDEVIAKDDEMAALNTEQQWFIRMRAHELKCMHPDKANLFDGYIKSQQAECDELETDISGVAMLLKIVP